MTDQQLIERDYFRKLLVSIWVSTGLICLVIYCMYILVQQWRQKDIFDLKEYIDRHACVWHTKSIHQQNDQKVFIDRPWSNEDTVREIAHRIAAEKERIEHDMSRNSSSN